MDSTNFPAEIWNMIFSYLTTDCQRTGFALTCRSFYRDYFPLASRPVGIHPLTRFDVIRDAYGTPRVALRPGYARVLRGEFILTRRSLEPPTPAIILKTMLMMT